MTLYFNEIFVRIRNVCFIEVHFWVQLQSLCSASSITASSSEEKQEKWHLVLIVRGSSHIISADILLTPLRRSICSVVCDNVWNPVGHRDMVLIGVTPWHFQPIRAQRWSLPTNQMPPLTICPGHPRCLGSHGECGSLSRLVTFGVMFLLDTENEFTWHCIGNWDCLHLISRPN